MSALLPYKMKLEAMKRQAGRPSKNSAQVGRNFDGKESREILAEQVGQSRNQISRYIRLTELIPELLDMVDEKKIAFNPAYELLSSKKRNKHSFWTRWTASRPPPPSPKPSG